MKKLIFALYFIVFWCAFASAQSLQIQGDSAIAIVEGTKSVIIDSLQLEQKINQVKQTISAADLALLRIEGVRAKELEKKSKQQSTLTYFLEVRNKYFVLKKQLKNK